VDNPKTQFVITGFSDSDGFRIFRFEGVAPGRLKTHWTVTIDLALSRRYGIQMQELPLLCRGVLDRHDNSLEARDLTYSEADMNQRKEAAKAARLQAARNRKPPRRPSTENNGSAWRPHRS
jgi:hypothetical protein